MLSGVANFGDYLPACRRKTLRNSALRYRKLWSIFVGKSDNFVVYDRYQAEAVADYLQRNNLASVEVMGHDIGIGIGAIVPPKARPDGARRGRPPSGKPAMTDAERKRRSRAKQRLLRKGREATP